jgi:hypothetical protein
MKKLSRLCSSPLQLEEVRMLRFTDINQFRNVVRAVLSRHDYKGQNEFDEPIYSHDSPYPTIKFRGTVKLHGTNAGIVKYKDGYKFQSRENTLSLSNDNYDFVRSMMGIDYQSLFDCIQFNDHVAIYGEWCGGNVQGSTVGIGGLPKMFVIFAVRIDDVYQDMSKYIHLKIEGKNVYNILQFENYEMEIDFNFPEKSIDKLIEITNNIEKCCPVAKYFGKEGVGEGAVWEYIDKNVRYIFKVKGEKHQSSRIKKLVSVNVEEIENIRKFAEYAVTESRLNQGIEKLKLMNLPVDMTSTGEFIKWIVNDIIKEESDTIVSNQIDVKKARSEISKKSADWFKKLIIQKV